RFTVKIAKYQKNDPDSNTKLIQKIAKWIEKLSARSDNRSAIANKGWRYFFLPLMLLVPISVISFGLIGKYVIGKWMAFDMYPEYEKESREIMSFIIEMTKKCLSKDILLKGRKPADS
ncbi:MAG: hypothetical protein KGJ07_09965, partial [Patescibacteria group bacterium]|nr:hypothetical protein [Patescibacteria group bacterium]